MCSGWLCVNIFFLCGDMWFIDCLYLTSQEQLLPHHKWHHPIVRSLWQWLHFLSHFLSAGYHYTTVCYPGLPDNSTLCRVSACIAGQYRDTSAHNEIKHQHYIALIISTPFHLEQFFFAILIAFIVVFQIHWLYLHHFCIYGFDS